MQADGTNVRRLTDGDSINWVSAEGFSPDGTQILFTGNPDGDRESYVMRADGSDVRRLTDLNTDDSVGIWSPDGDRILFASDHEGQYDIYTVNDGSAG